LSRAKFHYLAKYLWALAQSRGDGHRSLVTPESVLSEYSEGLTFSKLLKRWRFGRSVDDIWTVIRPCNPPSVL